MRQAATHATRHSATRSESRRPFMKQRVLVLSLLLAGLCLLVLGQTWTRLVPSTVYWDDAQAKEYSDAQIDLHEKSHHQRPDGPPNAEFQAAHERFDKISSDFEHARNSRNFTGTLLTVIGVLLLISGVGLHWAGRQSD